MNGSTLSYDTIIIGGGQAGLAIGYYLQQLDLRGPSDATHHYTILDANQRIGDSWRNRWDSLHLFTPVRNTNLPGLPYPASPNTFPSKDEMADYLESYASQMVLPVQSGVEVERVLPAEDGSGEFVVVANGQHLRAEQVVVATGAYQSPKIPEFAKEIAPEIRQFHSSEYRNPAQLQQGDVLVVGAGNSGAEIALDVAHKHPTILSGRSTGFSPFRPESAIAVIINTLLVPIIIRVINVDTSIGRKLRTHFRDHGQPVVRVNADDLNSAGVERINARVQGVEAGKPKMADGRVLDVGNIIWCTGFRRDFSLIELPIFDDEGHPLEYRGVVPTVPGIYFVGLVFQSSILSTLIGGVGKDAKYIAKEIAARRNASKAARAY